MFFIHGGTRPGATASGPRLPVPGIAPSHERHVELTGFDRRRPRRFGPTTQVTSRFQEPEDVMVSKSIILPLLAIAVAGSGVAASAAPAAANEITVRR